MNRMFNFKDLLLINNARLGKYINSSVVYYFSVVWIVCFFILHSCVNEVSRVRDVKSSHLRRSSRHESILHLGVCDMHVHLLLYREGNDDKTNN